MNHLSAGLLAGIPLALVFIVYMGVRGKNLVIFFKGLDGTGADIPDRGWFVVILIAFLAASFLFGIVAGLVYGWLPDMVLPCYAAVERLDHSLVEAAQDLYANRVKAFLRVIFPLTLPGVVAGSILVFIPSLGAYVTPDLLGGAKSIMIGNVIYSQFMSARDYPFGAAISFILMAMMLLGTLIYFRSTASTSRGETHERQA